MLSMTFHAGVRAVVLVLVFLSGLAHGIVGVLLHQGVDIREGVAFWYMVGPALTAFLVALGASELRNRQGVPR